ncbi:MAG: hypothetical protein LBD45_08890, partial [Bacteroidales bacterium]|nr:hypothetical protein [Bacteroidales bacterium]
MNKFKKIVLISVLSLSGMNVLFADNQKGIDYYEGNMLETAKIYFNDRLPSLTGNELAEACYY